MEMIEFEGQQVPASSDYVIALQRAIEYHCKGKIVPDNIAIKCPHHAAMLNCHLSSKSSGREEDLATEIHEQVHNGASISDIMQLLIRR